MVACIACYIYTLNGMFTHLQRLVEDLREELIVLWPNEALRNSLYSVYRGETASTQCSLDKLEKKTLQT